MSLNDATNPVAAVEPVAPAPAPEVETTEAEASEIETEEVESEESGEETQTAPVVDDTEEIEHDGLKVRVPKALKDAFLRHADYTRKTQELAKQREEFQSQVQSVGTVHQDFVDALANVKAVDAQLRQYENVDWTTFEQTDPTSAAQHWRQFSLLKDERTKAERSAAERQQTLAMASQRARATRGQEVAEKLREIIPEWSPGSDIDLKLTKYGTEQGLSEQDLTMATLRNPSFVKLLDKARQFDDLQKKQATQQRIERQQSAKPATEVGTKGSSAIKDPERMSTAEWMEYERKRLAKKAAGR